MQGVGEAWQGDEEGEFGFLTKEAGHFILIVKNDAMKGNCKLAKFREKHVSSFSRGQARVNTPQADNMSIYWFPQWRMRRLAILVWWISHDFTIPYNCSKDEQGQECMENSWKCSLSGQKKKAREARKIVFVVGWMCYSKLLSAREVMNTTG